MPRPCSNQWYFKSLQPPPARPSPVLGKVGMYSYNTILCFDDDTLHLVFLIQSIQTISLLYESTLKHIKELHIEKIHKSEHHISGSFQVGRLFTKRTSIQQLTHEKSLRHYLTRESLPTEDHYRYFWLFHKFSWKADIEVFKVGVRVSNKECRGDIWHDCELRNCFSSTGSWQTTTCSWDPLLCLQSPFLWSPK